MPIINIAGKAVPTGMQVPRQIANLLKEQGLDEKRMGELIEECHTFYEANGLKIIKSYLESAKNTAIEAGTTQKLIRDVAAKHLEVERFVGGLVQHLEHLF